MEKIAMKIKNWSATASMFLCVFAATMMSQMKKNPDGSLTLYIQKDPPEKAKESNWLPAPDDTIYLVMRLYWPKETPSSVLPAGSGTWQPPPVVQAS
jgi:hypothetical protein